MSVLLAVVLASASALVESVGLVQVREQIAVRVVVSGTPGLLHVHRAGDTARLSIADAALGARFAGGRRFVWASIAEASTHARRTRARLERLELTAASADEVSLLLRLPAEAPVELRRDARGVLVLFHETTAAAPPVEPVGLEPVAVAAAAPAWPAPPVAPPGAAVDEPQAPPATSRPAPATAPVEPRPPAVKPAAAVEPPATPAESSPPPASPPAPAPPTAMHPPVTADLARALFPAARVETDQAGEAPSVADLYAQLFPSGPPAATAEPAVVAAAAASDDSGLLLGPFEVRAGVDVRYVDADTFVDESAAATRDRFLEVSPRVQAEAPVGAGRFTAEYTPWLRAFATYDEVNTSSHVARVGIDLPVGQSVALRASDRFVTGTLDTRYADPGGEYFFDLGRFRRNDVDAGASVAIGPRTSLELAGTLGTVRFTEESSFFDYDTRLVSAGLGYELTPSLRVLGEYVYDTVPRPEERPEAESTAHQGRLTLRGDILPLLTGELGVGYRTQSTPNAGPGGTHYSGLTLRGSLERRLSPEATLGVFLSRSTPVSAFEENAFYVATMLQGTLVLPLPLELQFNGGLGYQWSDYKTVASEIGVPREDRILGWFVGLRRPLQRRLYLSGMYRAEDRRSNLDGFDVDTDGFYIQLEWNPLGPSHR